MYCMCERQHVCPLILCLVFIKSDRANKTRELMNLSCINKMYMGGRSPLLISSIIIAGGPIG